MTEARLALTFDLESVDELLLGMNILHELTESQLLGLGHPQGARVTHRVTRSFLGRYEGLHGSVLDDVWAATGAQEKANGRLAARLGLQ